MGLVKMTQEKLDSFISAINNRAKKDLSNVTTLPDAVKAQLKGDDGAPGEKGDPGIPGESGATADLATATSNGLMSKEDKVILEKIVSAPTGSVIYHSSPTAPTGYLKANGAAISRTAYSELFAAIGTTFGTGNGTTTFNIPDLRGEFIRGFDDARGIDSSRVFGSLQVDSFKTHTHTVTSPSMQNQVGNGAGVFNGVSGNQAYTSSSVGGTETRPRNIALLACIKY